MVPQQLIKKHAFFSIVFATAKGTVYFVPLLLADVLTSYDFGVLEYALAGLGFVVNALINLGVPAAYPYFVLRKQELTIKNGFVLHTIWLLLLFGLNQLAYYVLGLNLELYIAFNISFIIANQVFYSSQLKSHEKAKEAVLIDSGIYLVLLLLYVLGKINLLAINIKTINWLVFIYALFYCFIAIIKFKTEDLQNAYNHYKKILKFSFKLMISTFLIFLITSSGRIIVEYFFNFETVGVYAFYFRLSAVVVMIHQIINIAFFKKIYTLNPQILDKYFNLFFIILFFISVVIFFLSPFIVKYFSNYFNETYVVYKALYFLLSAQMVMWIATALNSNIIDRENVVGKNNIRFIILILFTVISFFAFKKILSLELLIYIHYTAIYIASMIQYYSLSKKEIYFFKSSITLTLTFLLTSCYYFIFL